MHAKPVVTIILLSVFESTAIYRLCTIKEARLGNMKENMIGDLSLLITEISATFRHYVKYHVQSNAVSLSTRVPGPLTMAAQGILQPTAS